MYKRKFMKTIYRLSLTSAFLILMCGLAFSQAKPKKPTIMVLPSDNWCKINGFTTDFDNQGTKTPISDYKRAFLESSDLNLVISKINGLMADRGFPLKNAESALKSLAGESAEDALLTSKSSGAGVSESPIDKLKKTAKADIIIQIGWTINATGPKKSISFNMQGLDSYTDVQIATAVGTGAPSFSAELPVLLEEAVLAHIDNFNNSLQAFFDDMFANGRNITIRVKKFDSWDKDLETEYDGKELNVYIEEWVSKNAVNGKFSASDATENMMVFEQVRMPPFDDNGKALDAKGFCRGLQNYLKNPPFNIVNKLMTKGQGQASIVLGDK